MNKILAEKALAALLTAYLVTQLHWTKVVLLYIVMGHGHFLIAYLYQYKAGKMTRSYVGGASGTLALLFGAYALWPNYPALVALTTVYFLVHMLLDELYLTRFPINLRSSPMTLPRALEMAPIFLLYSSRVVEAIFTRFRWGSLTLSQLTIYLSWIAIAAYLLLVLRGFHRVDGASVYFLSWSAFLLWASHSDWFFHVATGKLTGFIIIYHYLAWYLHYFLNLGKGEHRRAYLNRVVFLNALVFGCYGLWGQGGPTKIFFQDDYFYLWTLLHLITSTRLGDLRGIFRLSTASPPSG